MSYQIEGPFPLTVRVTEGGVELDFSAFLIRAVFTELVTQAAEDPEGLGAELADIGGLLQSAVHQGRDSHARHEFDSQMERLVVAYANEGSVPLYAIGLRQLRDALVEVTAPREVPAQRREGGAAA